MSSPLPTATARGTRRIPGDPEFWIFVFGDLTIFGLFYSIWAVEQHKHGSLFAAGHEQVSRGFGVANTLILISSSALVALGLELARSEQLRRAGWLLRGGASLGLAFGIVKAFEYGAHLHHGQTPATNNFFMYYFVFTGIHLLHVLVGTLALFVISGSISHGRVRDPRTVESVCVYWHMVDLVWLVWFYLIYVR